MKNTTKIKVTTEMEVLLPYFSKSKDSSTFICIHKISSATGSAIGIQVHCDDRFPRINITPSSPESIPCTKEEFAAAYGVVMAKLNMNFDAIEKEVSNG